MSYKPDHYTSVSPYLIVDRADRTIAFLAEVLGGKPLRRIARDDEGILHAEVRLDDSIIMLADSAEGMPAVGSHVHIYVEDVDAAYAQALEWGAQSVQAPVQKDDEDKRGAVQDGGGVTWWLSTHVGPPD